VYIHRESQNTHAVFFVITLANVDIF